MTSAKRPHGSGESPDDGSPVWRRDFPHTSAGEEAISRRAFTRYLIAGSGAFAASTLGAAAWTSVRDLDAGTPKAVIDLDELPEGQAHLFRYPGPDDPAMLIHLPGGALVAYSQKCTHLGCVVFFKPEETELVCPCHEGIFDPTTGDPVAGPPERPLPTIAVEVRDNTVWALGIQR